MTKIFNQTVVKGLKKNLTISEDGTIEMDAGKDTIHGQGNNLTIQTGDDDDIIDVSGFDNIITSGKGNDTVNAGRPEYIFTYALGDGNDIISKDAIINLIDRETIGESIQNGKDIVLKFTDGGSITIKKAASNDGNNIFDIVENDNYEDYLGFEVVKNNEPSRLITLGNTVKTAKADNYLQKTVLTGRNTIALTTKRVSLTLSPISQ